MPLPQETLPRKTKPYVMAESVINTLFVAHADEVKRFIAAKFGDAHDAEDIVHDAFRNILACDHVETIDDKRAYLYKTAQNLALNRIRKQKRHQHYVAQQQPHDDGLPPERTVDAQRDLEAIRSAISTLPQKCQRAFLLSRIQHRTYAEISAELNVSVSTVEKYIITALQFLREHIGRGKHD